MRNRSPRAMATTSCTADPGNDVIDGGSGSNTAFYTGVHGNFRIEVTDGRLYVEDRVGSEGVDTLVNVQFLQFADGGTGVDAVVQRAKERSARSQ